MSCGSCSSKTTKKSFIGKYFQFVVNGALRKSPVQVTLFVTSRCNIRCKMCFYWEPVENSSTGEITLDETRKLSEKMPPFFWLLIGGGEPFVRKDLAKIVKYFYDNNGIRHVSIPTNATYGDQIIEQVTEMLTACPDLFLNLNLSLNGLGKEYDELVQTPGAFDKFLSTYQRVAELKKKLKNLGLGLNLTHSKYNQEGLNKIIDFVVQDLPAIDNISLGLVRGRPKETGALNVDLKYYKSGVQRIENYAVQKKVRSFQTVLGGIAFTKDMIMRRVIAKTVERGFQIPCLAGKVSLVIDEKLNVYPCEMLSSVGNLRQTDYDLSTILNGPVLREAVAKIKSQNCFCTHECSYSTNVLFNYRLWLTIVRRYIEFRFKRGNGAEKMFKEFEDLVLPAARPGKQFAGQSGTLYKGGKVFGIAAEEEKTYNPARPF